QRRDRQPRGRGRGRVGGSRGRVHRGDPGGLTFRRHLGRADTPYAVVPGRAPGESSALSWGPSPYVSACSRACTCTRTGAGGAGDPEGARPGPGPAPPPPPGPAPARSPAPCPVRGRERTETRPPPL